MSCFGVNIYVCGIGEYGKEHCIYCVGFKINKGIHFFTNFMTCAMKLANESKQQNSLDKA